MDAFFIPSRDAYISFDMKKGDKAHVCFENKGRGDARACVTIISTLHTQQICMG